MIIKNISKSFGNRNLFRNLSFEAEKGLILIEGPSGCGKSTLFSILMGIEKPDEGEISLPSSFAYAGQEPSLFYDRSLVSNKELLNRTDETWFRQLVEFFSFTRYLNKPLDSLSGGERQKAEIIFCLSQKAEVYFLDEPFSGLDQESKQNLVTYLNGFSKEHLVFLINHDDTLTTLKPNSRIVFKDGNAIAENPTITIEKKVTDIPKQASRPFLACVALIRNHPFSFVFQAFLLLCFSVCFAFGTSFTNPRNSYQTYDVSLKADPFEYHTLSANQETVLDSSFFYTFLHGDGLRRIYLPTNDLTKNGSYFLDSVSEDDQTIYYYPNQHGNLFQEGQIVTLDQNGTEAEYTVKTITKEDDRLLAFQNIQFIREMTEGISSEQSLCLVNRNFIDAVLENDTSCVHLHDGHYAFSSLYGFCYEGGKLVYSVFSDFDTIPGLGFHFGIPGFGQGTKILVGETEVLTTEDGSDLERPCYTKEALQTLLFLTFSKYSDISRFSVFMDKEDAYRFANTYHLTIQGVIHDYTQKNGKALVYFLVSGVLFFLFVLYRFLSYKGEKRNLIRIRKTYEYNRLSRKGLSIGVVFYETLKVIPSLLSGYLLYFFFLVPFANEILMKEAFQNVAPGYYYYSMQPKNSYYDSIQSPLLFISYHPLISLIALVSVVSVVLFFLQDDLMMKRGLKPSLKKNGKRK